MDGNVRPGDPDARRRQSRAWRCGRQPRATVGLLIDGVVMRGTGSMRGTSTAVVIASAVRAGGGATAVKVKVCGACEGVR